MSVLVIFNPISGAGRARGIADQLAVSGGRRGLDLELLPTRPGFQTESWLAGPLQGRDALVVVGGDGAVRLVAPEAARAGVPLLHCPAGNENLFAREFGMQADPEMVTDTLVGGEVRRVDLIRVAVEGRPDEIGVLMASFGLDAEVVHDLSATRTGSVNNWSYVGPTLRKWWGFDPVEISARVDGETVARDVTGLLVVANSRQYAARLDPAPEARMDDGSIDLVILPCRGRMGMLAWMFRTWRGRHQHHPTSIHVKGRRIEFDAAQPVRWQVDGDPPHDPEPIRKIVFEVMEGALPVLVPPAR